MQEPVPTPPAGTAPEPTDAAPVLSGTIAEPVAQTTDPAPPADGPADPGPADSPASEPVAAAAPSMGPAACGQALAQHFPALFGPDLPPRPLKLRIQADIQQRAPGVFSRKAMGLFFSRHTTTTAYLKALLASASRFDLDGQPAGDVTDEHRQAAQEELNRRRDLVLQRRAAQRPPRGPGRPAGPTGAAGALPQEGAPATAPADGAPATEDAAEPSQRPAVPPARPPRRDDRGPRRPQDPGATTQPRRPDPRRDDRRGPPPPGTPRNAQRPAGPPGRTDARQDTRHEARPGGRPGGHPDPRRDPRREPRHDARPERPPNAGPRNTADNAPALPTDPAQRDRAVLLRQFETSPLSKANFCALKGLKEPELDAVLAQARQERGGPAGRQAGVKP